MNERLGGNGMKNELNEEKRLSELLREWKVGSSLPARFQEQVWNRIARAQKLKPGINWAALARWIEGEFARPALAVSYVALLLAAGLVAGFWQAHSKTAQGDAEWRTRYVQMVDPYQMPR